MKKIFTTTLVFLFVLISYGYSTIIHVPSDYSIIQNAIDASVSGDTVLVNEGEYFENINLHGKNILLTSNFYFSGDYVDIENTIINGSDADDADSASVITIISGETSDCIIQGFTIKGGEGTKWLDEHGAGTYREGGGILIQYSSPIIQFNYIMDNHVTNSLGVASTGGGAIRCGDSNAQILNNIIINNEASGYGGGLVFNYCEHAVIRNNLIAFNEGGEDYGGGGIWCTGSSTTQIAEISNNTIVNNYAPGIGLYAGRGGGVFIFSITAELKNNIIWNNEQETGGNIYHEGGEINATYCDFNEIITGTGNIHLDPLFLDSSLCFLTAVNSPCVDAGDPASVYEDVEDVLSTGNAMYPSSGNLTNDMGMYGGQHAFVISDCPEIIPAFISDQQFDNGVNIYPVPATDHISFENKLYPSFRLLIYTISGDKIYDQQYFNGAMINLSWDAGIYMYKMISSDKIIGSGNFIVQNAN